MLQAHLAPLLLPDLKSAMSLRSLGSFPWKQYLETTVCALDRNGGEIGAQAA